MAAWFNKKTARAMAKMAESLKAESRARAQAEEKLRVEIETKSAIERKVKAEAEKMLLTQFNRYSVLVERAEAKAKEAMATASAQVKEAEEKVQSYEAALAQAEEQLNETKEQLNAEALARAEAEESLKSEIEERKRAESQLEDSIAAAKSKAEEKVQSYAAALTEAKEKPIEAKGQVKTEAIAQAKEGRKTEIKERRRFLERPEEGVYTLGRIRRNIFHPGNIKRKFILLLVLVIFSAITFALSVGSGPPPAEPGGAVITDVVQFSDDNRLETGAGSYIYYEFSDVSLPANAAIKSAVLFVEHFEEERCAEGKLEWSIGTGRPGKPAVWATMKAPVHEGESSEAVDAWDITSVVDTAEKINSLQLQIKNNNNIANGKTLVDYAYVVVEYH